MKNAPCWATKETWGQSPQWGPGWNHGSFLLADFSYLPIYLLNVNENSNDKR